MSKNKVLMKSLLISLITFSGAFALQTINHTNNVKADQVQQNNKLYNHSNVMLIDVARQHMNANEIKSIINNTNPKVFQFIQLHLGDDQGFSVKVPILDNQGWITTKHYLSNYAAQKGISLVPDIDVPGHCGGIIK